LDEKLKAKILFEISQIDKLIGCRKELLDLCQKKAPVGIELDSAALLLHSFYIGIEKILEFILKDSKERVAESAGSHMELLDKAFVSNANRNQIFKDELREPLDKYLKFRHFIRHSYGFQIEWSRMEHLIKNLESVWSEVKECITDFINPQPDHPQKAPNGTKKLFSQ
jgi:hypothetical protein